MQNNHSFEDECVTNWPLEGAEFLLHCVDGQISDRKGTTGKDGSLLFDKLPNGTYELQETKPPKGYSEKGTWADGGEDVKTIVLTSDCEPILTYERRNTSKTGILIYKIDAVTKLPLAGVTFRITPGSLLTGNPFDHTTEEGVIIIKAEHNIEGNRTDGLFGIFLLILH